MKKIGRFTGFLCMLAFGAVLLAGSFRTIAQQEDTISEGVYIGNVNVGGMTEDQAKTAVESFMSELMGSTFTMTGPQGSFQATAYDMGVTSDMDNAIKEALGAGNTGNLIERFKENKQIESGKYVVDMHLGVDRQKTAQLIDSKKPEMDIEAVDNGLTREGGEFVYVEGKAGREINVVESVYAIEQFLREEWDFTHKSIDLVVEDIQPKGSREELESIKDVLGSYSTNFSSSSYERATNVKNGCAKINGAVLYPGQEFSVYDTVNPFTKENGYELAGSYANGTTVESFGGGICQVSTTLYNAAIRAELEITQRYNHSMIVSYVEPSMDAAIAGTYKDFKFVNNYDTPIYIEGYCDGGIIYFNIYGKETRDPEREISFESETLEKVEPETEIKLDKSIPLGSVSTSQSAHIGYVAQLWKTVTVNGVQESREVFNKSTYKASPKIIVVGTKGAKKQQLAAIKQAVEGKDEEAVRSLAEAAAKENEEAQEDESGEDSKENQQDDGKTDKTDTTDETSPETDTDQQDDGNVSGNEQKAETGENQSSTSNEEDDVPEEI